MDITVADKIFADVEPKMLELNKLYKQGLRSGKEVIDETEYLIETAVSSLFVSAKVRDSNEVYNLMLNEAYRVTLGLKLDCLAVE